MSLGVSPDVLSDLHDLICANVDLVGTVCAQAATLPANEYHSKTLIREDLGEPKDEDNPNNAWAWRTKVVDTQAAQNGKLAGLTVVLKDNVSLKGVPMRNGSKIFDGYIPHEDAVVAQRILAAGGTIVGKAHCEDLCLSGGSFTNHYVTVTNPIDGTCQAGGSSSGSAALVGAGAVDLAIGGDQGGSIRIPSSWCGVVGLKPTWGRVPYTGIHAIEPTFDHTGPIAKTVHGAALFLDVLAGPSPLDHRTRGAPSVPPGSTQFADASMRGEIGGIRIGVLKEAFGLKEVFGADGSDPKVDATVRSVASLLGKNEGAIVSEVSVPLHSSAGAIWTAIGAETLYETMYKKGGNSIAVRSEASHAMAIAASRGLHSHTADLSLTNKLFLLLGEHLRATSHGTVAACGRQMGFALTEAYEKALQSVDVLVMPTTPMRAQKIPNESIGTMKYIAEALKMIANTAAFNITGHPAITLPVKVGNEKLPAGFMIVGKPWDEATILQVAAVVEKLQKVSSPEEFGEGDDRGDAAQ